MNMYRLLCLLFASLCSAACLAAPPPVLVISVDGLHPAYVTEADRHGLKIPALRRLMQQGAHARGVVGVVPTVTYPSHTTLMTGLTPRERAILSMYYGLEEGSEALTLEAIGERLGVTRERIRQIRERAFEKLRHCPDIAHLKGRWVAA